MKNKIILGLMLSISISYANKTVNETISLDQAITIALENSEKNKISKYDIEIAKAQYKQAMSASFPSLDLEIAAIKREENIINHTRGNFSLPSEMTDLLNEISQERIMAKIDTLPLEHQGCSHSCSTI